MDASIRRACGSTAARSAVYTNLFALAIRSGMRATDLKAHVVCVSYEWLKYDAHALERSKGDHDTVHSSGGEGVRSKQVAKLEDLASDWADRPGLVAS